MTLLASAIRRVSFTVAHLARTEDFFGHLGFVRVSLEEVDDDTLALLAVPGATARRLVLRLGAQEIEALAFDPPGRPYPPDSTATDAWFQHIAIVVGDMDQGHRTALRAGARPITPGNPVTLPPNTGGVTAFKFRDPDGHPLELLHFPPGTGDARWQARVTSPFLGIDHTAVVVRDIGRSVAFYERLGLSETSRSLNRGPTQERLDDVEGDRVDVVAFAPARSPPHLELLGYRAGSRRPAPPDQRPSDAAATRTIVACDAASPALAGHATLALLPDPDGHVIILGPGGSE